MTGWIQDKIAPVLENYWNLAHTTANGTISPDSLKKELIKSYDEYATMNNNGKLLDLAAFLTKIIRPCFKTGN